MKKVWILLLPMWVLLAATGWAQSQNSAANRVKTMKEGNWSDPLTWSSLRVPNAFDSVSIEHQIVIDVDAECRFMEVKSINLIIQPGKFLKVAGVEPVISEMAYKVDTSVLQRISLPAEESAGLYKFMVKGGQMPQLGVGNILVGSDGGGYLRRVTAISVVKDTIVATTVQGTMEEVFKEAQFSVYFDGSDMVEMSSATTNGAPAALNETAGFTYTIDDETIIEYGLGSIELTKATFELAPSFQFNYDFGLLQGFKLFEMKMDDALLKGDVDFDIQIGQGTKEYEKERVLKRFSKSFPAIVGGVPVKFEAELMFIAKAEVNASALSFTRNFKYQFDYRFDAGLRWENNKWTNTFQVTSFNDSLTFKDEANINGDVNVKITLTPKLAFRVYSVAGPNVQFPTSLTLGGRYFYDGGSWDFGMSAQSDLEWGSDIKIGKLVIDEYGPYNLWTKQWFDYKSPFKLKKISGDGQTASDTSNYLPKNIVVQVLDSWDKTCNNIPVFFRLRQGGTLSETKVYTDDSGYAAIRWKPNTDPVQILDVTVKNGAGENVQNSPDSFFAKFGADTLRVVKTFNMANTPAFTTNFFKSLGVGKGGYIYAGTANNGLYKYADTTWSRSIYLTNNNIHDMQSDKNGGLWIAQYGSSGAQATNGGINYFPDSSNTGFTYYGATLGAPTRNARGIFIDSTRTNGEDRPRIWTAHMAHITSGNSTTGAIGLGMNAANPFFTRITSGIDISLQNGSIQCIGGNAEEVWAFASNNFGKSQIVRYDAGTNAFLGAYDHENITVPGINSNFSARAIYFDAYNTKWIGLLSGGLVVKEGDNWLNINMPEILPAGTSISTNGISGGGFGKVFIATSNGLLIFSGGSKTDPSSYKLLTMADGLPSNNVLDVVERKEDNTLVVATGSGISFIKGY